MIGPESVPDVYTIEQHVLMATRRRRSNSLCSGKSVPISNNWSHVTMCFWKKYTHFYLTYLYSKYNIMGFQININENAVYYFSDFVAES